MECGSIVTRPTHSNQLSRASFSIHQRACPTASRRSLCSEVGPAQSDRSHALLFWIFGRSFRCGSTWLCVCHIESLLERICPRHSRPLRLKWMRKWWCWADHCWPGPMGPLRGWWTTASQDSCPASEQLRLWLWTGWGQTAPRASCCQRRIQSPAEGPLSKKNALPPTRDSSMFLPKTE